MKNVGYLKSSRPAGLTSMSTLGNIFFCSVKLMDDVVYKKEFERFPFQCLFNKDQPLGFLDDYFKTLERIGGTVTFLEGELIGQMNEFKRMKMN